MSKASYTYFAISWVMQISRTINEVRNNTPMIDWKWIDDFCNMLNCASGDAYEFNTALSNAFWDNPTQDHNYEEVLKKAFPLHGWHGIITSPRYRATIRTVTGAEHDFEFVALDDNGAYDKLLAAFLDQRPGAPWCVEKLERMPIVMDVVTKKIPNAATENLTQAFNEFCGNLYVDELPPEDGGVA